tara:strand:- start:339 stop:647 length:309 start_codon:yes stop_codon:yes gene_type:complete
LRIAFFFIASVSFLFRVVEPSIHILHHHHEDNEVCDDLDVHFHEKDESCSWSDASLLHLSWKNPAPELPKVAFIDLDFRVFSNKYFKSINTYFFLRGPPVIA